MTDPQDKMRAPDPTVSSKGKPDDRNTADPRHTDLDVLRGVATLLFASYS